MALRFAFLLLLSVCAFGAGIAAPTPENVKCGLNQEFQSCGSACVPDCLNPEEPKLCTLQCVIGCFCTKGYLKNAQGECVLPHDCDARTPMQLASVPTCPANEVFNECGSACAPNCANPHPSARCTKNCVIGCFCKEGYLRNGHGLCVPAQQCEAPQTPMLFANPPECKENEIFESCGTACPATCANPHPSPVCTRNCVIGCFCKPGYLKNEHGVCVPSANCGAPVAEAMMSPPQCSDNEEYRQCKGCDGDCEKTNVICPSICLPGCACKEGYVRNNGICVLTRECPMLPPQCGFNEEFQLCKGCDGTCDKPEVVCPSICLPGCACTKGYVRNNGMCVLTRECPAHVNPLEAMVMPSQQQCSDNEEYRECKGCDGTCKNRLVACPLICIAGCACKKDHVRENGRCILAAQCAQVEPPMQLASVDTVPTCPANEEFNGCGSACAPNCANPHPSARCTKNCVIGCFCKEGYLRNGHGLCVPAQQCEAPQSFMMLPPVEKCGEHEIFRPCGTACPATCANPHPSPVCTRNCVIGCFCQEGYLKNAQGVCVAAANCDGPRF